MAKPTKDTKVGDVVTAEIEARVVAISEDKKTFACVPLSQPSNITVTLDEAPVAPAPTSEHTTPPEAPAS